MTAVGIHQAPACRSATLGGHVFLGRRLAEAIDQVPDRMARWLFG